jgi:uncharacterized protein (DUF1810 family)
MKGDTYNLNRFVDAQDKIYNTVLQELQTGRKTTHWMWFIFPQLKGLGNSAKSEYYGISGKEEALAYLAHPVLRKRLENCFTILLQSRISNPVRIFGHINHQKLHSSATLFSIAEPENQVFQKIIEKFWGIPDFETEKILNQKK